MDLNAVRAALADTARRANVPGMSLAVVSRDRVLFAGGTGHADLDTRIAATADTAYPWFSMTKPVTATAALRLADQGLLDLHAPVNGYVDWLRAPGRAGPGPAHHVAAADSFVRARQSSAGEMGPHALDLRKPAQAAFTPS